MKKYSRCLFIGVVLLALALSSSCVTSAAPAPNLDFSKGVHFSVYASGHIIRSGDVKELSPAVQELGKVLRDCSGKWRFSLVSYAPGIEFRTDKFSINMQAKRLIVNSPANVNSPDAKEKWAQVICDIPRDEFAKMSKLLSAQDK
jgi:hypothetical protein